MGENLDSDQVCDPGSSIREAREGNGDGATEFARGCGLRSSGWEA